MNPSKGATIRSFPVKRHIPVELHATEAGTLPCSAWDVIDHILPTPRLDEYLQFSDSMASRVRMFATTGR